MAPLLVIEAEDLVLGDITEVRQARFIVKCVEELMGNLFALRKLKAFLYENNSKYIYRHVANTKIKIK